MGDIFVLSKFLCYNVDNDKFIMTNIVMNFSKILFFLGAGTAVVRCAGIEQRFMQIQDALSGTPA